MTEQQTYPLSVFLEFKTQEERDAWMTKCLEAGVLPNGPVKSYSPEDESGFRDAGRDMISELLQCRVEISEAANVFEGRGLPGLARVYRSSLARIDAVIAKSVNRS